MHIPDGYLGPQTYGVMYAAMGPLWYIALKKVQKELPKKHLSLPAIGSAFVFVIMMFNIPIPGGATGHAVGGALLGVLIGPWAAMISISMALAVQALVFGDGGITTLAANCFALAFIMPFSASYIFRFMSAKAEQLGFRWRAGAFLAGYIGLNLAALFQAFLLGIQPILATSGGRPLYAPYPLLVTMPATAVANLLFFGLVEGLLTGLVLVYLVKSEWGDWPELVKPAILSGDGTGG